MSLETQQDRVLALHEDGFTPREIFNELVADNPMCSIGSVYAVLSKFRLKANQRRCPHCGQQYNLDSII